MGKTSLNHTFSHHWVLRKCVERGWEEWGKFLVRSCINLFNLGADGKGVDSTNNLWIVHECSPIIHEGGGRGGDQSLVRSFESFKGLKVFEVLRVLKYYLKPGKR